MKRIRLGAAVSVLAILISPAVVSAQDLPTPPQSVSLPTPPPTPVEGFVSIAPLGTSEGIRQPVTFQPSDPDFQLVSLRLDGVDVTPFVERDGDVRRFTPIADLAAGEHSVTIEYTAKSSTHKSEWRFTSPIPPPTPQKAEGWSVQAEGTRTIDQSVDPAGARSYHTPLSGTPHAEGSISKPDGSSSVAYNVTLSQQYEHENPPTHVSFPAVILGAKAGRVSATLGNGPVETFAPSLLLSTMSTRRGLEMGLDTGAGSFRAFGNIDDGLPSAAGVNQYRQNLYGASFAPAFGERFKVHVSYQYAADERDPLFTLPPQNPPPPGGGASLVPATSAQPPLLGSAPRKAQVVDISTEWSVVPSVGLVLKGEVARSAFSADSRTLPVDPDWAYAASLSAAPLGFNFQAGARVIGEGFGSPANPGLLPGRDIYDVSIARPVLGSVLLSASFTRTDEAARAEIAAGRADTGSFSASYQLASTATSFSLSLQGNSADSGRTTNKGTNVSLNIAQPVGGLQLSLGVIGGSQTTGGFVGSESRTSGASLGIARMGEVFSLQANVGLNHSRSVLTAESTDSVNAFVQPDLALLAKRLSLTPIGVYARMRTASGLGDSDSWSWGGRMTVRTWGALRGFAFFGQYVESVTDPKAVGAIRTRDRKLAAGLVVLLGGGSLGPMVATQMPTPQTSLR